MGKTYQFTILPQQAHQRLDRFLSQQEALNLSRSRIQKILEMDQIRVNGQSINKASYSLRPGDVIDMVLPEPRPLQVVSQDIPLDIVYEDDSIVVVNKPAGMVVHPAAGNFSGTLVNALIHHCRFLSGIGGVTRPGIVHRLDKDTSGLLIVAKTDTAHRNLSEQIKARVVKRVYKALIYGAPSEAKGEIKTQIGRHVTDRKKMSAVTKRGRLAITRYEVEEYFQDFSLLKVCLQTGRTHQIRVHLNYLKHPVVGDAIYGYRHPPSSIKKYPKIYQFISGLKRQALHAQTLGFVHPEQKNYMEFSTDLPQDFARLLGLLEEIKE